MQTVKISIKTPSSEVNAVTSFTEDGFRRVKTSDEEAILFVIRDLLSSLKYSTVTINPLEE